MATCDASHSWAKMKLFIKTLGYMSLNKVGAFGNLQVISEIKEKDLRIWA